MRALSLRSLSMKFSGLMSLWVNKGQARASRHGSAAWSERHHVQSSGGTALCVVPQPSQECSKPYATCLWQMPSACAWRTTSTIMRMKCAAAGRGDEW